jgi:hypothetical protein
MDGVVRGGQVEVGSARIPVPAGEHKFSEGAIVKLIFRPEDVLLGKTQELTAGLGCLAAGIIEETSFVGAYERVRIRLERSGKSCDVGDTPFYLTTETPESQSAKPIIATRPKPETLSTSLRIGDRVFLGLTSFTILPRESRTKKGLAD